MSHEMRGMSAHEIMGVSYLRLSLLLKMRRETHSD